MSQYRISISQGDADTLKELGDGNLSLGLAVHMKLSQAGANQTTPHLNTESTGATLRALVQAINTHLGD